MTIKFVNPKDTMYCDITHENTAKGNQDILKNKIKTHNDKILTQNTKIKIKIKKAIPYPAMGSM